MRDRYWSALEWPIVPSWWSWANFVAKGSVERVSKIDSQTARAAATIWSNRITNFEQSIRIDRLEASSWLFIMIRQLGLALTSKKINGRGLQMKFLQTPGFYTLADRSRMSNYPRRCISGRVSISHSNGNGSRIPCFQESIKNRDERAKPKFVTIKTWSTGINASLMELVHNPTLSNLFESTKV